MVPDAIPFDQVRRVLIIKLRHHGDVLLTSPVIAVLKAHYPHLEIDALVYSDTAPMLAAHPGLSQLHMTQRKGAGLLEEWALFRRLRARRYDVLIHLTDSSRGAWLARLLKPRWAIAGQANKPGFWRKSFTHLYPIIGGNRRHTVEIHLDALRRAGLYPDVDERKLVLVPGEAATTKVQALLAQHGLAEREFIQIHPASRWLFKCWPANQMAALINQLTAAGETVVLTGAPDEKERALVAEIEQQLTKPVINLVGQLNLKELAALTQAARLFIGMDSVPMHIAAAMQTPTVALFGPSGDIEWAPWQVARQVLTSSHPCRPCGKDGCGGGKRSECLDAISVDQVAQATRHLLHLQRTS
ncbi:heptosyltransferase-3 [Chitinivorax tropicus]|uniref:Heptosyltransferase-3 n=1 Tax=Chitinivorax tropicus TaxID=714531 RepID=A0A840MIN8_9PROT|nr:putative lipopolysaccharide heptosyltransferase III [Chitinivorax tropicus]MBB5017059.1 heptosyltransferase-3 [Chitinivorax tropicus]